MRVARTRYRCTVVRRVPARPLRAMRLSSVLSHARQQLWPANATLRYRCTVVRRLPERPLPLRATGLSSVRMRASSSGRRSGAST